MKIYIKYMVSLRCKLIVKEELQKLGIPYPVIELGTAEMPEELTNTQRQQLKENLSKWGLELLDDKKTTIIEKIKNIIIEMIHYTDDSPTNTYSDYISKKMNFDYNYLSNLFSEVKGITIQQYIIVNKIEKVKELMLYNELTLTEISYKLHYSSVAHLSNQFKKITGHTPSHYKQQKAKRHFTLECV